MVTKAKVKIEEKEKSPQEQALELVLKRIEKPVQPPPITETMEKVNAALAQAQKAQHKPVKQTWYCTDCGRAHIQNDGLGTGLGHIQVDCLDGEFVDPGSGQPLSGKQLNLMENYAVPNTLNGRAECAVGKNRATLAKMDELKSKLK